MTDLDDEYETYLWGESSPRSFAQKALVAGTKKTAKRVTRDVSSLMST